MSVRPFEDVSMPTNTKRVYEGRFAIFSAWCAARGLAPVPSSPEVIQEHLVTLADEGHSLGTIAVSRAAIVKAHVVLGHAPPNSEGLNGMLRALRRARRDARQEGISPAMLETIVAACKDDALAERDRTLLLVMYHGDFRRSEVIGLNREDCRRDEEGYRLRVVSRGRKPALVSLAVQPDPHLCPVAALDAWLAQREALVDAGGPLFVALHPRRRHRRAIVGQRLSPEDVDRILKRRASATGLERLAFSPGDVRVSRSLASMNVTRRRSVLAHRAYERGCPLCHDNGPDNALRTHDHSCTMARASPS